MAVFLFSKSISPAISLSQQSSKMEECVSLGILAIGLDPRTKEQILLKCPREKQGTQLCIRVGGERQNGIWSWQLKMGGGGIQLLSIQHMQNASHTSLRNCDFVSPQKERNKPGLESEGRSPTWLKAPKDLYL